MDACKYCKTYHPEWQICDEYIKALEKGKIKLEGQVHSGSEK